MNHRDKETLSNVAVAMLLFILFVVIPCSTLSINTATNETDDSDVQDRLSVNFCGDEHYIRKEGPNQHCLWRQSICNVRADEHDPPWRPAKPVVCYLRVGCYKQESTANEVCAAIGE